MNVIKIVIGIRVILLIWIHTHLVFEIIKLMVQNKLIIW